MLCFSALSLCSVVNNEHSDSLETRGMHHYIFYLIVKFGGFNIFKQREIYLLRLDSTSSKQSAFTCDVYTRQLR